MELWALTYNWVLLGPPCNSWLLILEGINLNPYIPCFAFQWFHERTGRYNWKLVGQNDEKWTYPPWKLTESYGWFNSEISFFGIFSPFLVKGHSFTFSKKNQFFFVKLWKWTSGGFASLQPREALSTEKTIKLKRQGITWYNHEQWANSSCYWLGGKWYPPQDILKPKSYRTSKTTQPVPKNSFSSCFRGMSQTLHPGR